MKHSKDPIRDIFKTLEDHGISPESAAHILKQSKKTGENWWGGWTVPSSTNYQRLRFLLYLVENPILVSVAANQLYREPDKLKHSMKVLNPFSSLSASVESANVLNQMNYLRYDSLENGYKLSLPIKSFISKHRRQLLDSIYLMHRNVHKYGDIRNFSLQILNLIDNDKVKVPKGFEVKRTPRKALG